MATRRAFIQGLLAAIPATVIGRGFMGSAKVPAILAKYTPQSGRSYVAPGTNFADHGWHLYEVGGQSLFPIYGHSGGISPRCMSYLVRLEPSAIGAGRHYNYDGGDMGRGGLYKYKLNVIPVEFSEIEFSSIGYSGRELKHMIHQKIRWALKNVKPTLCDERGCFPMPPFKPYEA